MDNKEIANLIKKCGKLLELHDENVFKVRSFQNAAFNINKISNPLKKLSENQIAEVQGIGKSLASKIIEIIQKNTFEDYENLISKTPKGVIEMLTITGLGPKKVRTIWKDEQIETIENLKIACQNNQLIAVKGIGESLQMDILEFLEFKEKSKGKYFYADLELIAFELENKLKLLFGNDFVSISGEIRRKMEVVETIQFLISTEKIAETESILNSIESIIKNCTISSPYIWRGNINNTDIKVEIRFSKSKNFGNNLYLLSCSNTHLELENSDNISLKSILKNQNFLNENEIFSYLKTPFLVPEIREGMAEINFLKNKNDFNLIDNQHIKGCLHNHSLYSDGENTVEEMANACINLGLQYFGISDHSQTANYAGGLKPEKVLEQHKEIDDLNKKYGNSFKIFKGIESDILADGSLDYSEEILQSFDFIVASIHANLRMDLHKATERLVKAIENPYTTILGHSTGRLLLRRKGYPIDYQRVIDACAMHGVVIELNANPWRLDLDWRFIDYATNKGVMISINPDAHEISGLQDMRYGVNVARKGGLSPEMCFNTKNLEQISDYFKTRKPR